MKIVVALGGNALARRGEVANAENLRRNVRESMKALVPVAMDHELVLTHGNGPQVGLLALQNLAYQDVAAYPLDILGAETQGMLGYVVGQELMNAVELRKEMATILTTTVVSRDDPAYTHPTKFVGPVYDKPEADRLAAQYGWDIAEDGKWWRRVVPSPEPQYIRQSGTIRKLLDLGLIVLCVGGGGVPVFLDEDTRTMTGTEAVIDKDLASAVLARDIGADRLLMLTDADAVYLDWGTPAQRAIRTVSPEELGGFAFAAGSMGPKVDAANRYAQGGQGDVVIGALSDVAGILAGEAGTRIFPGAELTFYEDAPATADRGEQPQPVS